MKKRKIDYRGNFPVIDVETGEVKPPAKRYRIRHEFLDKQRREKTDPRPLSAYVAFDHNRSVDARAQMMVQMAMQQHYGRLIDYEGDLYDDDDFDSVEDDVAAVRQRDFRSPHEFVFNKDAGRELPRGLKVLPKAHAEAIEKKKGKKGTPDPSLPPSAPVAPKSAKGDEGGGDE